MPAPKSTPERKSRSGSYVPDDLRGTERVVVRCTPEVAANVREHARRSGQTLAQVLARGVVGPVSDGCQRNVADPDEDPAPPFRIAYRPCGAPTVADVIDRRRGPAGMCLEHAREAEREGCEVDWPTDSPKRSTE